MHKCAQIDLIIESYVCLTESWTCKTFNVGHLKWTYTQILKILEEQICLRYLFNLLTSQIQKRWRSHFVLPSSPNGFFKNIIIFKYNILFIFIEVVTLHLLTLTWAFMMCINLDISSGHSRRKWKWSNIILGFLKEKQVRSPLVRDLKIMLHDTRSLNREKNAISHAESSNSLFYFVMFS